MMSEESTVLQSVHHIESLIQHLEHLPDPALRTDMQQLVRALMAWHGAALERLLILISHAGEAGQAILQRCVQDDAVASVLLLYDLHPTSLQARVQQALAKVRPSLQAHGSDVELLSLTDGVVRVRLQESGQSSTSSTMTFKLAVEAALYETAPDMVRLEVEDIVDHPVAASFIPLAQFRGVDHSNARGMAPPHLLPTISRHEECDSS